MITNKTVQERIANDITNYFFQNCEAFISKKDYDFVVEKLNELLSLYTINI